MQKGYITYKYFLILTFIFLSISTGCKTNEDSNINPTDVLNLGSFTELNRNSSYIIAAPHGKYDYHTADIVTTFCNNYNWDCLIATGYRTTEHPYNVNRPTEKIGVPADEEVHSEEANIIYQKYLEHFNNLNGSNSKLYLEIHGNSRDASQSYIEIAQVGIDASTGASIKSFLNTKLSEVGINDVTILWQGDTNFYFNATSTKEYGILSVAPKAMHLEIPYNLRTTRQAELNTFLSNALPELVATYFP